MNKIYSVTELTKILKNLIETNFNSPVKVTGEISSLSFSPNGHCYFVLKDEYSQIKIVYFKSYVLNNANRSSYSPKNGDHVEIMGTLTVYEKGGEYQLIARTINYDSVGEFYRKYEETKKRLEAEGFFDKNLKKPLPFLPKRIAVLTSIYGAAIKDFINTSEKNLAKYTIDIWPVQVQGTAALNDIIFALKDINRYKDEYNYDLIVLMRGGGSLEDLAIFNEEAIARALADCEIPTVTAIGHERDITICDLVADRSFSTPTQAAMILSQPYSKIIEQIVNNINIIRKHMEFILHSSIQQHDSLMSRIALNSPMKRIENLKIKIDLWHKLMIHRMETQFVKNKMLINLCSSLCNNMKFKFNRSKDKLDGLTKRLINLGPENVLKRGYAIVMKNKTPILSINSINIEDELEIRIYDGYINSFVTAKKNLEVSNGKDPNN
jgi:exodeoxyribonuclease VII large subunit